VYNMAHKESCEMVPKKVQVESLPAAHSRVLVDAGNRKGCTISVQEMRISETDSPNKMRL
jgi:hypothetical protein